MENYLTVFIFITLSNNVFCWRNGYYGQNNVKLQTHKKYHDNDDYGSEEYLGRFEDKIVNFQDEDYKDRIIFPDSDVNVQRDNWRSTTVKPKPDLLACIASCDTDPNYVPVCGTDNVTYKNVNLLQCAAKCGSDVRILHHSECFRQIETTTKSSIQSDQLRFCLSACPTTSEYNPVCGTDSITYHNVGKLTCAQYCGVDVRLKLHSSCPRQRTPIEPTITTSTARSTTSNIELSNDVITCIHSCPKTSEYNPVCGSNGQTYYNSAKLDCARYCGIDVTLVRRTPCFSSVPRRPISQDELDSIINNRDNGDEEISEVDIRNH